MGDVPGCNSMTSLHPFAEVTLVARPEKHPHTHKPLKVDPNPVSPRPLG